LAALNVCPEKTIVTIRDWPWKVLYYNRNISRFMRLQMAKKVFKECDYYTANSEYINQLMSQKYKGKHIVTIPNSIDMSKTNISEKSLHAKTKQIISVNNGFFEHKNGNKLLEAFKIIRDSLSDVELHLYGAECENNGSANIWAVKRGLEQGVLFHGKVAHTEVMEAMRKADLLIHPSLEESFGNTLIEAMISKTPVVGGTNSGAVPWVLGEGKYGELADVTSADDIAEKALGLLTNSDKWQYVMERAYNYAIETYNMDTMVKRYLEAYEWRLKEIDENIN
jgi:glycosyltransferase involved in cell wall biosynthesis